MSCDCTNPTCEEMLCNAINAYNELIAGKSAVEVTFGDHTTKYSKGDKTELLAQIRRLHTTCGNDLSAAILGIKNGRAPASARFSCR